MKGPSWQLCWTQVWTWTEHPGWTAALCLLGDNRRNNYADGGKMHWIYLHIKHVLTWNMCDKCVHVVLQCDNEEINENSNIKTFILHPCICSSVHVTFTPLWVVPNYAMQTFLNTCSLLLGCSWFLSSSSLLGCCLLGFTLNWSLGCRHLIIWLSCKVPQRANN